MGFIVRDNTPPFYQQSPLKRVTKKRPCPICGKPTWCSFREDEGLALCMRESAGSTSVARNGAYVHVLRPYFGYRVPAVSAPAIGKRGSAEQKRADSDRLNAVYTYLLEECLTLRPEHADHLLNERGLGDTVISAKLYASVPDEKELPEVCAAMAGRFGDGLRGVPGFYRNEDGKWWMPQRSGFFIPIRDALGRVVGLQSRSDGGRGSKYLWLSTNPNEYTSGTSSGTPAHFSKPDLARRTGRAIIIEGALKGDIVSELEETATIAITGVQAFNPDTFGQELRQDIPQLRETVIAFDADWKTNEQVNKGLLRLGESLEAARLKVKVREWDSSFGKGLDDALLNEERKTL